jgi:hypothetical protein
MDPETGHIAGIVVGPILDNAKEGRRADGLGTNSDEGHASSVGGDRVYWMHFARGGCDTSLIYNMKAHEVTPLNTREYWLVSVKRDKVRKVSVAEIDPVVSESSLRDSTNASGYYAAAIWRDLVIQHMTGMKVYVLRGLGTEGGK